MRVFRLPTAALLVGLVLPVFAAPAASAQTASQARSAAITDVEVSCNGDTVQASAVLRADRAGRPVVVRLFGREGNGPYRATGQNVTVTGAAGKGTWSLNIADLRRDITHVGVSVTSGGDRVRSESIPVASCAPGTEVPEAPVALLVPLTLAATAGGVLALRGRRGGGLRTV